MKKITVLLLLLAACTASYAAPSAALNRALPLLQKASRTPEENQQVLTLFRSAKEPDVVFAAGASLVKTPPTKAQEPALFNLLVRQTDGLKQTFSAVILTAMGGTHEELLPVLQHALDGKDPLLRAYAAAAYTLIRPDEKTYTEDIVRLYIFDPAFATRALFAASGKQASVLPQLKTASASADEQVRSAAASWLGSLHTEQAAKQLLKMAKKENAAQVQASIATALAAQRDNTLPTVAQGLQKKYTSAYANTCALALGFMTGHAVDTLRQNLRSTRTDARINAARAAAYMANVLSNPDAFAYSSDREFDIRLLKGLIAPLNALANSGSETEKEYAQNALRQIEKLME